MKHKSYSNGNNKVKHNGKNKGHNKHQYIVYGMLPDDTHKLTPFTHIIGNNKKYCCNGWHGNKGSIGHKQCKDSEKHNCVYHTCNGCSSSVFDVCGGTCYRTCGGDTSEECRADVTYALSHKLHIGIVLCIYHFIGNNTGKKGFDCGKDCNGNGIGNKSHNVNTLEIRKCKLRQGQGHIGVK